MGHDLTERSSAKRSPRRFQHGGRKINGHRRAFGMVQFDQCEQPSVSGAEIKNSLRGRRE